ncbi:MAG TPA: non-canonical purine NTP pyrophosphatase [Anaeromyxobacter sp.]|nr:non-canonical purine NTP pyrophosphatase [Anaeromyxobacter sp.]
MSEGGTQGGPAVLFATTNPGKLRELRRMVAGLGLRVLGPGDLAAPLPEVVEDGATFTENARKKAVAWAAWSGLPTLADDSGLCVEALGGAPGVHSARWSELDPAPGPASPVCELAQGAAPELGPEAGRGIRDERNNDKLLRALEGVPDASRGAEYQAVLCLARPDGSVLASVTGRCPGRIGHVRRGRGGFGYDPLFLVAFGRGEAERTMAELDAEEKDALSHRGEAFRRLLPVLAGLARSP